LWNADEGYDSTLAAFDASLERLGIDRLDRYLIHRPSTRSSCIRCRSGSCAKCTLNWASRPKRGVHWRRGRCWRNPTVTAVAEAHRETPAQVLIRWHIQLGNIVIPKSVTPERIVSNFDVFDFELSESDLASISSLEDGTRTGPDPRTYNFTG